MCVYTVCVTLCVYYLLLCVCVTLWVYYFVCVDYTQAVYGSVLAEEDIDVGTGVWPPTPVLKAYAWWCEHVDPLLAHNPLW